MICGGKISANQRSENHPKQGFANHTICGDLRLICGLQITLLWGSFGRQALVCWLAGGLLASWFAGLLVCWLAGLLVCWLAGLLAFWLAGLLTCWLAGLLVWRAGLLVWLAGLLTCLASLPVCWLVGLLELIC